MAEFVAMNESVRLFLDSIKLSCDLNSINFGVVRTMADGTTFCDEYKKFVPTTRDANLSGAGFSDFTNDANNEQLYNRLSTEGHIVSIDANDDAAYFYKTSLEKFDPLKADSPEALHMFEFSLKKFATAPVIRGEVAENSDRVFSTPSAPSAALKSPAAAGNVDDGTHTYKVTFVNALGESAPSAASGIVTVADQTVNGQVTVTITTGPSGTTSRKIYRTVAGNTGNYKLVGTVANNTATTFNDNVADSGLGADAPSTGSYTGDEVVNLGTVPSGKQLYAVLHVIAAGTGNLVVTIESDDNSGMLTPATVFSFTTATGLTAEIKNGSSNLQQYYRAKWTVSAGSGWQFFIALGYAK